jgi:protein-S-isoprenylcysteine O-methyltransferase
MSAFHYLEFLTTALTNPFNLSVDSYLLNHSVQYGLAAMASWIEYAVEIWAFPSMKTLNIFGISGMGVFICLFGDSLRKLAMFHAGQNFNHIVQGTRSQEHELVTYGVFSLVRHPSYVGWFLFSLGTQLILCNPMCFTVYGIVSWRFFAERIYVEEYILLQFFGDEYSKYQESVPYTGIPFIKGFKIKP